MQSTSSVKQTLAEPENTKLVRTLLAAQPAPNRHALAQELCCRLGLRDPKGDWRMATTAKALRDLQAEGLWKLPPPLCAVGRTWNASRLGHRVPKPKGLPESLQEVRGLRLLEVVDGEHLRIWNELMLTEHPLQEARLVGRQLRYLIGSDHGWLGGVGFGSAALHLEGRDTWIGWNQSQRRQSLERVLNMTRFLIRPSVRCANLASHVLGLCARRVGRDFERRYGLRPWLLESFVDQTLYPGSCYKAANWIQVGQTKGRGRNGGHQAAKSIKDIYVYALVPDWAARFGVTPPIISALSPESGLEGPGWAEQEFGECELGDKRLTRRLVKVVCDQATQPQGSYAQAAGGDRYDLKGYYRFLNNGRSELNLESLIQPHRRQTIRRLKREAIALIIQDTTDLNFSTRTHCADLGYIGANQTGTKSRGLRLHSSLALSGDGLPLGIVQLHGYAPQSAEGKDRGRPIAEKESYRWLQGLEEAMKIASLLPDTRIISVSDREADMFELFDFHRVHTGRKADLLIRAKNDRCLEETERKLFAELAAAPLGQTITIQVPRQREHVAKPSTPGRPALAAREAQVQIRFQQVSLSAPNTAQTRHLRPIRVWAVYLVEPNPPAHATPVEWLLLTTMEVRSHKQALQCVRWYCRRWRIEEWHRVLKSGCKALEHQNERAEVLLRAIALDAVIAWRIMLLTLLGRETPGLPCELVFDPCECEVLRLLSKKNEKINSHSGRPCS